MVTDQPTGFKYNISTFEDALLYCGELIDHPAFGKALAIAFEITENQNAATGPQAAVMAAHLSAYRVQIGLAKAFWRMKRTETKRPQDKLIVDALESIYDSLIELINSLKYLARQDMDNR